MGRRKKQDSSGGSGLLGLLLLSLCIATLMLPWYPELAGKFILPGIALILPIALIAGMVSSCNKRTSKSNNNDIISGYKFCANLDLKTPLEYLEMHSQFKKCSNDQLPKIPDKFGYWAMQLKSWKELGISGIKDIPSHSESDGVYLEFLKKFRSIAESDISLEEKYTAIEVLKKEKRSYITYLNKHGRDEIHSAVTFAPLSINFNPLKVVPWVVENYGYISEFEIGDLEAELLSLLKYEEERALLYALRVSKCVDSIKTLKTLVSRFNTAACEHGGSYGFEAAITSEHYHQVKEFLSSKYIAKFREIVTESIINKTSETVAKRKTKQAKINAWRKAETDILETIKAFKFEPTGLAMTTATLIGEIHKEADRLNENV